jgi:hypothetical protein
MERMSRDSTCCFPDLLASCNLVVYAMAVETAVDSLLRLLVPQTFRTEIVALTPTTVKCPAY